MQSPIQRFCLDHLHQVPFIHVFGFLITWINCKYSPDDQGFRGDSTNKNTDRVVSADARLTYPLLRCGEKK